MAGTTPIYGLPYPQSSDLVSAYPALGQDLAEDLDAILAAKANLASPTFTGTPAAPTAANGTNTTQIATTAFVLANAPASGLTLITAQSFSAASSVIVNNCFSATYQNYRVTLTLIGSGTAALNLRMRASGSDNTTSNYYTQRNYAQNTTLIAERTSAQNLGQVGYAVTPGYAQSFDFYSPNEAVTTYAMSHVVAAGTGIETSSYGFFHNVASAFDGFSLLPGSGTITGTVRVYGYKNS